MSCYFWILRCKFCWNISWYLMMKWCYLFLLLLFNNRIYLPWGGFVANTIVNISLIYPFSDISNRSKIVFGKRVRIHIIKWLTKSLFHFFIRLPSFTCFMLNWVNWITILPKLFRSSINFDICYSDNLFIPN